MKTIKREILKVGMFGPEGTTITKAHLADCAATFDGKCPIALGHKLADWMPKFGNIKSVALSQDRESLSSELEISDTLADAVDEKFYEDFSVGIQRRKSDGRYYLHHLAMLGAVPPKIRDLKVFADLGVVYCGDDGAVDAFTQAAPEGEAAKEPTKAEPNKAQDPAAKIPETNPKAKEKEEDVELKEENERLKKDLADARAVTLVTAKDGLKKAMEGRIPKAKHGLVLELADQLGVEDSIELSDEEGKKTKVSGIEVLRRVFEAIPKPVIEGRADLGDDEPAKKSMDLSKIRNKF